MQTMTDRSFPLLHPRPRCGWINDPNGVSFVDGRYHVFFQFNPDSARHHRICWGHLSSRDLLHWEEHPVALRPQPGGPDEFGCWSGVVTVDAGIPTAVYSGVRDANGRSEVTLARGSRDLVQWRQDGVVAAGMPDDPEVAAVRDPFLFEFAGHRWAVQGAGLASGHAGLLLYGADDLERWEYHGVWLTSKEPVAAEVAAADIWECPQLVRSGDEWIAIFSLWCAGDLSGVGHLVGSLALDASSGLPVFTPRAGGLTDLGSSFYAPQAIQLEGRVLVWGWAKEGGPEAGLRSRTQEASDAVGWSGVLTFPRELAVHGDHAELRPARELAGLRARQLGDPLAAVDGGYRLELPDQAEAVLAGPGAVTLVLGGGEAPSAVVWSGELGAGEEVRILIDASLIEVHRTGGAVATERAYPLEGDRYAVELEAEVTVVGAWELAVPA
jgi:beta-fructofuranosidase